MNKIFLLAPVALLVILVIASALFFEGEISEILSWFLSLLIYYLLGYGVMRLVSLVIALPPLAKFAVGVALPIAILLTGLAIGSSTGLYLAVRVPGVLVQGVLSTCRESLRQVQMGNLCTQDLKKLRANRLVSLEARKLAVLPDGKIYLLYRAGRMSRKQYGSHDGLKLARLLPDGSPDSQFAGDTQCLVGLDYRDTSTMLLLPSGELLFEFSLGNSDFSFVIWDKNGVYKESIEFKDAVSHWPGPFLDNEGKLLGFASHPRERYQGEPAPECTFVDNLEEEVGDWPSLLEYSLEKNVKAKVLISSKQFVKIFGSSRFKFHKAKEVFSWAPGIVGFIFCERNIIEIVKLDIKSQTVKFLPLREALASLPKKHQLLFAAKYGDAIRARDFPDWWPASLPECYAKACTGMQAGGTAGLSVVALGADRLIIAGSRMGDTIRGEYTRDVLDVVVLKRDGARDEGFKF